MCGKASRFRQALYQSVEAMAPNPSEAQPPNTTRSRERQSLSAHQAAKPQVGIMRSLNDLISSYDPDAPLAQASTIPASWYTDDRVFELEKQTVFGRSWHL